MKKHEELRCPQNPKNINTAPQFDEKYKELSYNFMTNIGFNYVPGPFHFIKDKLIVSINKNIIEFPSEFKVIHLNPFNYISHIGLALNKPGYIIYTIFDLKLQALEESIENNQPCKLFYDGYINKHKIIKNAENKNDYFVFGENEIRQGCFFPGCNTTFDTKQVRQDHIKKHYNTKQCMKCKHDYDFDITFKTQDYKIHAQEIHDLGKNIYYCSHTNRWFEKQAKHGKYCEHYIETKQKCQ